MADEGDEQEGGEDVRMQLVQQYCLKTIKQVSSFNTKQLHNLLSVSWSNISYKCMVYICY